MASKEKHYSHSILGTPVDTSDRFGKMSRYYHREAERCASASAYFSACILAAAALEALLLSYCYVEDRQVRTTLAYKQKKFKAKRNRFSEFNLYQLINIAAELNWIPSKEIRIDKRTTTLKELLHAVRETRNTIHPAVWAQEGGPFKVKNGRYRFVYEVFDVTREILYQRIISRLRLSMQKEKSLNSLLIAPVP
jgi:hypothetical protein